MRGPNVAPGHSLPGGAIAPVALDSEGFLPTGDAGRLADEARPRRAWSSPEDFGDLQPLLRRLDERRRSAPPPAEACAPLLLDAVIAGHDREMLGVLLFLRPPPSWCRLTALGPRRTASRSTAWASGRRRADRSRWWRANHSRSTKARPPTRGTPISAACWREERVTSSGSSARARASCASTGMDIRRVSSLRRRYGGGCCSGASTPTKAARATANRAHRSRGCARTSRNIFQGVRRRGERCWSARGRTLEIRAPSEPSALEWTRIIGSRRRRLARPEQIEAAYACAEAMGYVRLSAGLEALAAEAAALEAETCRGLRVLAPLPRGSRRRRRPSCSASRSASR